jgi:hypothetical protein
MLSFPSSSSTNNNDNDNNNNNNNQIQDKTNGNSLETVFSLYRVSLELEMISLMEAIERFLELKWSSLSSSSSSLSSSEEKERQSILDFARSVNSQRLIVYCNTDHHHHHHHNIHSNVTTTENNTLRLEEDELGLSLGKRRV